MGPSDRVVTVLWKASLAVALGVTSGCGDSAEPSCEDPGTICTVIGTGELGFNGDGNDAAESTLYWPVDLTFDPAGHAYLLDWNNHRVREWLPDGTLSTVIGTDFIGDGPEDESDQTEAGAPGTDVNLNHPTQVVPMADGQPILVSWHNHKLRRYDPGSGRVWVIAGSAPGFSGDGADMREALFSQPSQVTAAQDGSLYILDQRNQVVRKVAPDGVITTMVGTPLEKGYSGDGGPADAAKLRLPDGGNPPPGGGLALSADEQTLYISDTLNHCVRAVDLSTWNITTLAGTGEAGFSGDGGPAAEAQLNNPRKLTLGPDGALYVGDELNHRIRRIDLAQGTITTVVGTGEGEYAGDGGPARDASLRRPTGVSFDEDGAMYVIDTYNSRVRRVAPAEGM